LTLIVAVVGFFVGCGTGLVRYYPPNSEDYAFLAESVPLPHHVPSQRFGTAFRFAMVHDVIHERFPRHGPAYYEERNRQTSTKLATAAPDNPGTFPLTDDLAAGLARLGRMDEAISLLRAKLARQLAMDYRGRNKYATTANLGTLLVYSSYPKASAGDAEAVKQFREGVGLIRKAVELNPGAHFGREKWQAAFAEFLLAAMEKPEVLKKCDFLGNGLLFTVAGTLQLEGSWIQGGYGRATNFGFTQDWVRHEVPAFFEPGRQLDDPEMLREVHPIRKYITKVGAEDGWKDIPVPSHREQVAFDEPMLGIVDMWRQGGGANPHLALALGETMLRVGQRYIAWTACERAAKMAGQFWPEPTMQQYFRDHCRQRQEQIEKTFQRAEEESADTLRSRFNDELAYGERYQREYQRYEAEKIEAGAPISDEHFFDAFHAGHDPIASPVGAEEWAVLMPRGKMHSYATRRILARGLFGSGLAAMALALLMRWWAGRGCSTNEFVGTS
jgi:hypothetical protein